MAGVTHPVLDDHGSFGLRCAPQAEDSKHLEAHGGSSPSWLGRTIIQVGSEACFLSAVEGMCSWENLGKKGHNDGVTPSQGISGKAFLWKARCFAAVAGCCESALLNNMSRKWEEPTFHLVWRLLQLSPASNWASGGWCYLSNWSLPSFVLRLWLSQRISSTWWQREVSLQVITLQC